MQTLGANEFILKPKSDRAEALFLEAEDVVHRRTDRLFAKLMVLQWFAAVGTAFRLGEPRQVRPLPVRGYWPECFPLKRNSVKKGGAKPDRIAPHLYPNW